MIHYLRLIRLPYVFTALADVSAGLAVAIAVICKDAPMPGWEFIPNCIPLWILSALIYSAGMTLNDFADARSDSSKFPDRPIPSGKISQRTAFSLGLALLLSALILSMWIGTATAFFTIALICLVLAYNFHFKRWIFPGAICIGLCRGGNMLLGTSVIFQFDLVSEFSILELLQWPFLLVIFVSGISYLSSLEEKSGKDAHRLFIPAMIWVLIPVVIALIVLGEHAGSLFISIILLIYLILNGLEAHRTMQKEPRRAILSIVKASLTGIILFDGAILYSSLPGGQAVAIIICQLVLFIFTDFLIWAQSEKSGRSS